MNRFLHPHLVTLALLAGPSLLLPSAARAGEIFGTISERGVAKPGLALSLQCDGGPGSTGRTDNFGGYRLLVNFEGTCRLGTPGVEPAVVRSAREGQRYNLEIVRPTAGPAVLRRR
jgi:hypothetical protein